MQYLVLLYGDPADDAAPGTPEWDAEMERYMAFGELAGPAIVTGEALMPGDVRTVRHDGDEITVTDGPFAEVTEALGGMYVLEAPNLDDVIELARHIPAGSTPSGAIEIRPLVMLMDGPADPGPLPEGAARYFVTIHGPEGSAVPGTPEWDESSAAHGAFAQGGGPAVLGGGAVHPTSTATTIRVRDGELLVSDGPFLEAIEVVGGYYVLRGARDEVTDLARAVPVPKDGAVELRPVIEFG